MKKGLLKSDKMGDYEKEQGFASYRTIVERFIGDIVLCNNITSVDECIFENLELETKYFNENDEEISEEQYFEDDNAYCDNNTPDIFQYYLCNLSEWQRESAKECGLLLSYSDLLDCDVLCVDHFGTSWDYVLTNVKLFDTYEDLKKYEESE